jgi:predicted transcriptional regulator
MHDSQITSLEALSKVHKNLGARQALVLEYLRNAGPHTNAEISKALAKPINEITPRTHELRKLGLVLEAGKRLCAVTGNRAHAWAAKYPVLPPAFKEVEKPTDAQPGSLFV